jgi:glyoxylase-like metal-dependent hydrolase (beta-lactamase superfamily II)
MTELHRYTAGPTGAFVNAYMVEGNDGVVIVDGTLTVSDGQALRARADALGKPLLAVVVTHAHPDHYGGIVEVIRDRDIPVFATEQVASVIRRDDDVKEQILRPMFGDEWPGERAFPTDLLADGETLEFGDIALTVTDLGPGESPADSVWSLGDGQIIFLGDQIYDHKHAYLADGFCTDWLAHIARLERELPADAILQIGHGRPVTPATFAWQRQYIETFIDAVNHADWSQPTVAKAAVVRAVTEFLPTEELQFLMELSIEPIAAQLKRGQESATSS